MKALTNDLRPSKILTPAVLQNAITAEMALGGSSNLVLHLMALAHELNLPLSLETFDQVSRRTPFLCNVIPAGNILCGDWKKPVESRPC